MPAPLEIATPRLRLRQLTDADADAFAALNADPRVMEHFPSVWSRADSDAARARIAAGFAERGFGVYAVDVGGAFAGIVGLSVPRFEAAFTPCVEILWRISAAHWGQGIATEAAQAVLDMAFGELGLDEVVAFTIPANRRSIRVMEKLGMHRSGEFDHPDVEDSLVKRHVLYRLKKP